MLSLEVIVSGDAKDIVAIKKGGRCACRDYFETLDERTRKKLFAIMSVMANRGEYKNTDKFRSLRDGIYEFKARSARVFCFFFDSYVICTHGAYKYTKKKLNDEIKKAKIERNQFLLERR